MNIIPHDRTIHMLLNNPTEQLAVPSYQRRYAWGEKQTGFLFEDIDMLQANEGHLFGMLIIHTGLYSGGLNQVDIVDGQQRLTTIVILLSALREFFKKQEQDHFVNEISNMLRCVDGKNTDVPKLVLGELDNSDLEKVLQGNIKDIFNQNIRNAYELYIDWIAERIKFDGDDWLNEFYNKLVHTAKLIRLDVQQAQDAYKLFETINNRGLPLSATDILKNFILGHAAKIGNDKLVEVKELWSQLIVSLDGISTDDFFRQYVTSIYTRKITKTKLIDEFKKDYFKNVDKSDLLGEFLYNEEYYNDIETFNEDEIDEDILTQSTHRYRKLKNRKKENETNKRVDITDYLLNIVDCAACYSKIFNKSFKSKKVNLKLRELAAIRCFPSYIFLMHFLQKDMDEKTILKVLNMIGAIMLRRHVCSRRTSENDNIFAKLLRIEDDENLLKNIKEALIEDYPDDDEFEDRFPTQELKGILEVRAKYILSQLEYYITGNTNEYVLNSGNYVHLEHIIPQKITTKSSKHKYGDWETYLGDKAVAKHRKYVNRIGNMTLLAGDLNISASNNPFTRKKKCYRKSNIRLTQDLAENYGNFKFHHVGKRGEEFAEMALNIWKI